MAEMEGCATEIEIDTAQGDCEPSLMMEYGAPLAIVIAVYTVGLMLLRRTKPKGGGNASAAGGGINAVPLLWTCACVNALLAYSFEPWWVAWISWWIISFMLSRKSHIGWPVVGSAMWCLWTVVMWATMTLGMLPLSWSAVIPPLALLKIMVRSDPSKHDALSTLCVSLQWDTPSLGAMYLLNLFGQRMLDDGEGNFITTFGEDVCCSSLPMSQDPSSDEWKKARIKSVVNMCGESTGPVGAYAAEGIEQLRLPTVDMAAPTAEFLVCGVEFILAQRKRDPKSRVLVHCKGGRGRAATMMLAYKMATHPAGVSNCDPVEIVTEMKKKRKVIEVVVASYPSIEAFRQVWSTRPDKVD